MHTQRTVLMVYDRFPPFNVSGTARAFHFACGLPQSGYQPIVLTSTPGPEHVQDPMSLEQLPPTVAVLRAEPWLTPNKNKLARWVNQHRVNQHRKTTRGRPQQASGENPNRVFRRHSLLWEITGLPMWISEWHLDWAPPAFLRALREPRLRDVDLVWVSAPHVKNLLVAEALSRWLRRPLVVDLRDPWTYGSLWIPRGRWVAALERWHARQILSRAARVVVTSPLTQLEMQRRFPEARFVTITNGYTNDPSLSPERGFPEGRCLFRYVGLLNERRVPDPLLAGFALACKDPVLRARVHLEFVGSTAGHEHKFIEYGLSDVVSARGPVPARESLRLMRGSDVNVVLQTIDEGQDVISGKTFEYLAAHKPILAVISKTGGDAWLLDRVGCLSSASYEDPEQIADAIRSALCAHDSGVLGFQREKLAEFERSALTRKLASLFDEVLAER